MMLFPLMTPRLWIDPLTVSDIDEFVAYRQDPDVARFQSWEPSYDVDDAHRLIAAQAHGFPPEMGFWLQLGVRTRPDKTLLGDVAIHTLEQANTYELGVTLAAESQSRGIATEALQALLTVLFIEFDAHRVVAFCDTRNQRVASLLRRLGMRQESRQLEAEYLKGEWTTVDGYALLAGEHRSSRRGNGDLPVGP